MQKTVGAVSLLLLFATSCGGEDWGGPKGPRPATASASPPALPTAAPAASASASGFDAGAVVVPADTRRADKGDAGAGAGTIASIEGSLSGGKLPAWEEALAGMRPALKACVEGKGDVDAVVELTVKIGPKGEVTNVDKTGGSQFVEGAVPCLTKRLEGAQFKKPTEGSPRLTLRVKLKKE